MFELAQSVSQNYYEEHLNCSSSIITSTACNTFTFLIFITADNVAQIYLTFLNIIITCCPLAMIGLQSGRITYITNTNTNNYINVRLKADK